MPKHRNWFMCRKENKTDHKNLRLSRAPHKEFIRILGRIHEKDPFDRNYTFLWCGKKLDNPNRTLYFLSIVRALIRWTDTIAKVATKYAISIITWASDGLTSISVFRFSHLTSWRGALRNVICINTTLSIIMSWIEIYFHLIAHNAPSQIDRENEREIERQWWTKEPNENNSSIKGKGRVLRRMICSHLLSLYLRGDCIEWKLTDIFHSINDFTIQLKVQHHSNVLRSFFFVFFCFLHCAFICWNHRRHRPLRFECWVHSL